MNETKALLSKTTTKHESSLTSTKTVIPSSLRWTTTVASLLSVFLFSGIVFGWAPLELMLAREGQFNESCDVGDGGGGGSGEESEEIKLCAEQTIRLQRIFTVAQFLLNFVSLPVGHFVDRIPKGAYFGITAVFQVAGLCIFAISNSKTFDHFLLGYGFIALGGCMTMLGAFPASFLLPKIQLRILALISCLFDASSVVFFIFHRLTLSSGWSRESLFAILGCIGMVVYATLAGCWILLERLNWKDVLAREQKEQNSPNTMTNATENGEGSANDDPNKSNAPHKHSVLKQLTTAEFVLIAFFSSIHILRCNYYIMTADDFLRYLGDSKGFYANIFSFVLPSGIVFVPLIELTLVKFGIPKTLHLTNILGLIFGALLLVSSLKVQVAAFVIFTCFRAYLYSSVNAFIAVHFGVETMGRIVGCAFTAGAVVSLLQYPAAMYSGNGNWRYVNEALLGLCAVPIILVSTYKKMPAVTVNPVEKSPVMSSPLIPSRRLVRSNEV